MVHLFPHQRDWESTPASGNGKFQEERPDWQRSSHTPSTTDRHLGKECVSTEDVLEQPKLVG